MSPAGLSPQDMASMMIEADEGDPQAYLALAEEIEEKDLHYAAVLGTRKRQVSQLDMTVEAPRGADAANDPATQLVQEDLIDTGVIDAALFDMLDAIGKGFRSRRSCGRRAPANGPSTAWSMSSRASCASIGSRGAFRCCSTIAG
jgi:phage gp29-like protein